MNMHAGAYTGLPKDWLYSPSIDLEMKQYTLLGFLQRVKARFAERKLYPYLEHVQSHMEELLHLQRSKEQLARSLGGPLTGFDPTTGEAVHERPQDGALLRVIDDVVDFAVPGLMQVQNEGLGLRTEIEQHIRFGPVGLQPLHISEGWILLRTGHGTRVYGYSIPLLLDPRAEFHHRSVFTRYVTTYTAGITCTYEHMKAELIHQHPLLPNPATFVVETDLDLPYVETFVPLAKRLVHAHVSGRPH
ncbi:MAG: hypothetical protein JNL43_12965 [Flavobacteriales bacterium]|nr:hypothetical protein [Flavobacteriales bacterium]